MPAAPRFGLTRPGLCPQRPQRPGTPARPRVIGVVGNIIQARVITPELSKRAVIGPGARGAGRRGDGGCPDTRGAGKGRRTSPSATTTARRAATPGTSGLMVRNRTRAHLTDLIAETTSQDTCEQHTSVHMVYKECILFSAQDSKDIRYFNLRNIAMVFIV